MGFALHKAERSSRLQRVAILEDFELVDTCSLAFKAGREEWVPPEPMRQAFDAAGIGLTVKLKGPHPIYSPFISPPPPLIRFGRGTHASMSLPPLAMVPLGDSNT